MAEKIDEFAFVRTGSGGSKYERFLDGGIYRLRAPEDMASPLSAQTRMRALAREKGMKIRSKIEDSQTIVVQAYKP